MEVTRQDLVERLGIEGDDALLRLIHSGELTELAHMVAVSILRQRGVDPDQPPPTSNTAPRTLRLRRLAHPPRQEPSPLWWIYVAFYIALFAFGAITNIQSGNFSSLGAVWATAPSYCIDLIALFGLYGYIRSRRLLVIGVWQVILVVYVAKIVFGEAVLLYSYLTFFYSPAQSIVVALRLVSLPIAAPMAVALWLYAFRPAKVWQRAED
jgi:hypothetical protein